MTVMERAGGTGMVADTDATVIPSTRGMRKSRRWLLAAAMLSALMAGAAIIYMFFSAHRLAPQAEAALPPPAFVEMPDVLVSLSTKAEERITYLKLKAVLEVSDASLAAQLKPLLPRVIDLFQTYARELRPADLNGSMGLLRLREEVTRRANAAVAPAKINAVLFKEVIVQ